jgi:hypothetical protein
MPKYTAGSASSVRVEFKEKTKGNTFFMLYIYPWLPATQLPGSGPPGGVVGVPSQQPLLQAPAPPPCVPAGPELLGAFHFSLLNTGQKAVGMYVFFL